MRIWTLAFLAISALALLTSSALARPVSYPGGWTLMSMNDGNRRSAHIHYSPNAKTSIGYRFEDWHERDFTLHAIQFNRLLKRWNKAKSQANFYWKTGIGVANEDGNSDNEPAGFTGLAYDWETRRHFVSYENRFAETDSSKEVEIENFYQQSARLGWAPYEGNYGDLHTWLMLEVKHVPEAKDNFTLTPLVRLFKGVHMVEAGISNHGDIMFNYIFRN